MRIACDLLARRRTSTRSVSELDRELQTRTQALARSLRELAGCGPLSAAKLLGATGPIERFPSDAQLARHAGVAPLDASSGTHERHRLDRGGNSNSTAPYTASPSPKAACTTRARLRGTQTERGQDTPRSDPLPKRQLARTADTTLKNESY